MIDVAPGLLISLGLASIALIIGSAIRLVSLHGDMSPPANVRRRSLLVWWALLLVWVAAAVCGPLGLSVLLSVVGLFALLEFHRMFGRVAKEPFVLLCVVGVLGAGHYLLLVVTDSRWPLAFFPAVAMISISTVRMLVGERSGYLRATAGHFWSALLLFWGLSHCVALMQLPERETERSEWTVVGPAGWPLLIVLLTETDDIAQALVGRRWGRRKMLPIISPGKSWEGFWGGFVATCMLSIFLTPWLTTLTEGRTLGRSLLISIGAGVIVSVTGFLGDVNISALKREVGMKDSGTLLPGMGGMMDRIDSLTFTTPAPFYYAVAMAQLY